MFRKATLEVKLHPRSDVADSSPPSVADSQHEKNEHLDSLRFLQETLLRFPMASQAAFSALVAEGRQYAKTPDGQRMLVALARSPRTARARVIWEVLTMSSITDKVSGAIPSVYLDKLARTLAVEKLEPLLAQLFERRR